MKPRRCSICGCIMFSLHSIICECCLDDMREEDVEDNASREDI